MAKKKGGPVSKMKWIHRPKQRGKMPASSFLDSKNKKYPVKTPSGSYSKALVKAAIKRSAQQHKPAIMKKAQALLARLDPTYRKRKKKK